MAASALHHEPAVDRLQEAVDRLERQAEILANQRRGILEQARDFRIEIERLTRQPVTIVERPRLVAARGKPVSVRDLETVLDAVEKLQPTTTGAIATHLAVTEAVARSRLLRCEELGRVTRTGLRAQTRWSLAEEGEVSEAPSHTASAESQVRDAAVKLGKQGGFTVDDLMTETGLSRPAVDRWVKEFMAQGMFTRERVGKQFLYDYVPAKQTAATRTKHEAPENAAVRQFGSVVRKRGSTVQGTGRKGRITHPEVRRLIGEIREAGGCEVVMGGEHYKVVRDGQVLATIPTTPSDWRSIPNTRAELRRKNVKV